MSIAQKILISAISLLLLSSTVLAQGTHTLTGTATPDQTGDGIKSQQPVSLTNPIGTADIPTLIGNIIKAVLSVIGSLALVMFIYGGFTWMLAGGSSEKVKKGRDIITWAAIGLVVVFSSYALVRFVITSIANSGVG